MVLITTFVELLLIWCLMRHAMDIKYTFSKTVFVYMVSYAAIIFIDLGLLGNWLKSWIGMLLPVFVMYIGSIWIKIFWIIVYLCLKLISESSVILFADYFLHISVNELENNAISQVFFSVLANVLAILVIEIIAALRRKKRFYILKEYRNEVLLFSAAYGVLVSFCIFCMHYYSVKVIVNPENLLLIFLFEVLVISGVSILMLFKILDTSQNLLEEKKQIHRLENELQLNEQIRNTEKNLRVLRHNVNNTFGVIKGLLRAKEYEELDEYLEGIYQEVDSANELVLLENKALAVLLNVKKKAAADCQINYQNMISFEKSPLPDKELCDLIGNILDNAIEASKEVDEIRYIRLKIQDNGDLFEIECENSYKYEPVLHKGRLLSRKQKEKNEFYEHGLGTGNIREIFQRYSGTVHFSFAQGVFCVKGSIPRLEHTAHMSEQMNSEEI